jgi:hypothetical protein
MSANRLPRSLRKHIARGQHFEHRQRLVAPGWLIIAIVQVVLFAEHQAQLRRMSKERVPFLAARVIPELLVHGPPIGEDRMLLIEDAIYRASDGQSAAGGSRRDQRARGMLRRPGK